MELKYEEIEAIETGGMDGKKLLSAIEDIHLSCTEYAEEALLSSCFTWSKEISLTRLAKVRVSTGGANFLDGAMLHDLYLFAVASGLRCCMGDVGPHMLLKYPASAIVKVKMGMKPLLVNGKNQIFAIGTGENNSMELCTVSGDFKNYWPGSTEFLFEIVQRRENE